MCHHRCSFHLHTFWLHGRVWYPGMTSQWCLPWDSAHMELLSCDAILAKVNLNLDWWLSCRCVLETFNCYLNPETLLLCVISTFSSFHWYCHRKHGWEMQAVKYTLSLHVNRPSMSSHPGSFDSVWHKHSILHTAGPRCRIVLVSSHWDL